MVSVHAFWTPVEGTYEGALQHLLGCEVTRNMDKGTMYLSQTHHAEEI